jgi:ribosomal protein S18 acetylase RimI-like enzyme
MTVTITHAVSEDASAILALHRAVLAEDRWFISRPSEAGGIDHTLRLIRDCARHPTSMFLVARDGAAIVGFVVARPGALARMQHAPKLEIIVDATARGRGVGRALMAACVDWARSTPMVEKLGLSVFADNAAAIALYRSFGFRDEGRRVAEYKLENGSYRDDLLMYLPIRPEERADG